MKERTWIIQVAGGSVISTTTLESSLLWTPKGEHSHILIPSDSIPGKHSRETLAHMQQEPLTRMFKLADTRTPPKRPSIGEQMDQLWYTDLVEYDTTVKTGEVQYGSILAK